MTVPNELSAAEAKTLWQSNNHSGRRPAVWSPGEYLVIDWAQAVADDEATS